MRFSFSGCLPAKPKHALLVGIILYLKNIIMAKLPLRVYFPQELDALLALHGL